MTQLLVVGVFSPLSILLLIELQACKSLLRHGSAIVILSFSGSQDYLRLSTAYLHHGGFTNKIHLGMAVV